MRQQGYDSEDSIDTWTLTPEDHALVAGKSRANRFAFAALLVFFRANGRFPEASEIHPSVLARIGEQLGTDDGPISDEAWEGRTGKRHRAEIRKIFGFREPTVADAEEMAAWLRDHAVAHNVRGGITFGASADRIVDLRDTHLFEPYPLGEAPPDDTADT